MHVGATYLYYRLAAAWQNGNQARRCNAFDFWLGRTVPTAVCSLSTVGLTIESAYPTTSRVEWKD